MTQQQFDDLKLVPGEMVEVTYFEGGIVRSTGLVEFKFSKNDRNNFAENNLANDFYSLWTRKIISVKRSKQGGTKQ